MLADQGNTAKEDLMQRQNVQLLVQARHDPAARCEAGRRYLLGIEGMPRHVNTGIEHLTHPSLKDADGAATVIAECLSLEEIVSHGLEAALAQAAHAGCTAAQFKFAVWLCIRHGQFKSAARWLDAAAANGHALATRARASLEPGTAGEDVLAFARSVAHSGGAQIKSIAALAATAAADQHDLDRLLQCLRIALAFTAVPDAPTANLVVEAAHLCEESGRPIPGFDPCQMEACLEVTVDETNRVAEYMLGRALCGIACGAIAPASLVSDGNMRKGAALLLRAADGGCHDAWMDLYRVHADHRCSVANPQLARFFLEKAAILGYPEAQRRLGVSILRSASDLRNSENGIRWLHSASEQGDTLAKGLLNSLVLPLEGSDQEADHAIETVRRTDPLLAVRMRLSRDFGLTKLEALCVDPVHGRRDWGLVVGKNRFIELSKLSAPRAVPALCPAALDNLRRAAQFFEQAQRDGDNLEGDWRRRSLRQRRAFARHQIDENLIFARANSATLDCMRQGTKWALRVKPLLQPALAGGPGDRSPRSATQRHVSSRSSHH